MRDALRLLREKQAESRLQMLKIYWQKILAAVVPLPGTKTHFCRKSGPVFHMKEIELTPKAEADLVAIRNYSYHQFGLVKADA